MVGGASFQVGLPKPFFLHLLGAKDPGPGGSLSLRGFKFAAHGCCFGFGLAKCPPRCLALKILPSLPPSLPPSFRPSCKHSFKIRARVGWICLRVTTLLRQHTPASVKGTGDAPSKFWGRGRGRGRPGAAGLPSCGLRHDAMNNVELTQA